MATKLYEDATTKELVIERADGVEHRYAAFCELSRIKRGNTIEIIHVATGKTILASTIYSDLTDSGSTPYANIAAVQTALDGYFNATA